MSSDEQFTALGPAIIGFQTSSTDIDFGADIEGKAYGVKGRSDKGTGVYGECTTNDPQARQAREFGSGVSGSSNFGTGVSGLSDEGNGVHGFSRAGRGGVFESGDPLPQVQLVPHRMLVPAKKPASPEMFNPEFLKRLPKEGRGGDLLVTQDDGNFCTLWFCVQGQDRKHPAAQWSQVLLGTPVQGEIETPPKGKDL